jgi:sulfite reductase (NADPH) flavoprotein alpha-component
MAQIKTVCPYCGVGCGLVMEVEQNRVVKVRGDKQHPANFGRLCTKGLTCAEPLTATGRLEHAWLRTNRHHEPVRTGVATAITHTAQRLRGIIDQHGPDALAFYVSGQMSMEAQYLANKLAKGFVRTRHIESNSRLCMASAGSGYKLSLGADAPPGSYDDFDHADLFLVVGANMADCHPILFLRLLDRVKAGARLIVVDPRRNATADKAHLYLPVRPGTDLALLNGVLYLLWKNGDINQEFIDRHTQGWEAMPDFLADYTPEKVAEMTGLSEADIRKTAQWIAESENVMSCWTMGLNQSIHGTWNTNAMCNLHLATGTIGRAGNGPFSLTGQPNAMGGREMGYMGGGLPGQRSVFSAQDRQEVERLWQIAPESLRDEAGSGTIAMFQVMQTGDIKACWIICTNPVASVANRQQVIAGLEAAELVVVQDAFLDTETNRYADILLPGALWAEAEGVMVNSERNLSLMQRAVMPPGEAMPDWQIIASVACEMGFAADFSYASAAEVFDEIRQFVNPRTGYDIRGVSYARLREHPVQWPCRDSDGDSREPIRYLNDGIYQPLLTDEDGVQPRFRFATESGKAVFYARPYLPPDELPDEAFPWVLNTGRLQHQWHTMTKTGKVATLNKLNPGSFVELHPHDAEILGVVDKDSVCVRSRRGQAVLPALVTERVSPGQCFVPFHWNDVFGDALAINAVTNDAIDPISQQPAFKFCAVALARVEPDANLSVTIDKNNGVLVGVKVDTSTTACKEFDMNHIDALARLAGLDLTTSMELNMYEKSYMQGFLSALRTDEANRIGGVPMLPADVPFDESKRFLINGMLAGLFSRSQYRQPQPAAGLTDKGMSATTRKDLSSLKISVLWASQTGNVEDFASWCAERLSAAGYEVSLRAMNDVQMNELANMSHLLLLTSTFGDGDAPDNAQDFWRALQSLTGLSLTSVHYSVLAFGDSSYDQFCGFGRKLDAKLAELGAQCFLVRGECEPEYQQQASAWLTAAMRSLEPITSRTASPALVVVGDADEAQDILTIAPTLLREQRINARLVENRLLSGAGSNKEVRQFVLDLPSGVTYEPGDALGVLPQNDSAQVQEVLDAFGWQAGQMVMTPAGELPLEIALQRHYDVTRVTRDFVAWLSTKNRHPQLSAYLRADGEHDFTRWAWGKQVADVVREFPVKVTATEWLSVAKPLQTRLYSIASSARQSPHQVHLTVSVVRYEYDDRKRHGVASGFLADQALEGAGSGEISVLVKKNRQFRLPSDDTASVIMVGPGTGIAPFRAFLQERKARRASGKNWLIFGEQHENCDFYYREEWEALLENGILSRLDTAFSRDQSEKIYVQHRLLEQAELLWRWLQQGAFFYVCGDAEHMAKDVDAALKQVVQQQGSMSHDAAANYVRALVQEKRYCRDVY